MTEGKADLVIIGGRVLTMDVQDRRAEAVAVLGSAIVAVGNDDDVHDLIGPHTRVIEAHGSTVLPGINDSHLHACAYGRTKLSLDLAYPAVASIGDVRRVVADALRRRTAGEWIIGNGWDLGFLEECKQNPNRVPTRWDLDDVSPCHPVYLQDFSGHLCWVNTRALELAGIGSDAVAPPGGVIERDGAGRLLGLFSEGAQALVKDAMPTATRDEQRSAVMAAAAALNARGITSWTEPGLGPGGDQLFKGAMNENVLEVYATLVRNGELPGRVRALYMPCGMTGSAAEMRRNLRDARLPSDVDERQLALVGVKIMADGIPPNRTAWMYDEYEAGGHGALCVHGSDEAERSIELQEMIRLAHAAGFQVGVHTTGDRAIDAVVDAFAAAQSSDGRQDARHYVIHGDFVGERSIRRLRELGYGLNMNPGIKWTISDLMEEMLGEARSAYQWPVRSATAAGIAVCSSSDAPVTEPDWLQAVSAMLLRESKATGRPSGPEQAVDLTTALRAYTSAPALQDRAESWKGSLERGKVADICVLDGDIEATPARDLPTLGVSATVVSGRVVHGQ